MIARISLLLAVVSVPLLAATATLSQQNETRRDYYGHPHMWGDWGWGGMIFGPIMGILYIGLIVAAIVLVVRWLGGGHGIAPAPRGKTALQILEERFARGEIDKDEFEERRRLLSD